MFIEMDTLCVSMLRECLKWLPAKDRTALCMCTGTYLDTKTIRVHHFKRMLSARRLHGTMMYNWIEEFPVTKAWIARHGLYSLQGDSASASR